MDVKSDIIRVSTEKRDQDGKQIDPEEHLAERSIGLEAPMTLGGVEVGTLPGSIDFQTTAGSFAQGVRDRCELCKHWSVDRWRAVRRGLEFGNRLDHRQMVNEMRYNLEIYLEGGDRDKFSDAQTGELDIEAALDSMGLCAALTEVFSRADGEVSPWATFSAAGCPSFEGPHGEDLLKNFVPRDAEAYKAACKSYDNVMRMAQGKAPGDS
jgi:hypothetical protein